MDFFFFQAEDGIRDLVRSRGLGDVYKRQREDIIEASGKTGIGIDKIFDAVINRIPSPKGNVNEPLQGLISVSYTHLTLPTSDLV
mgnify:CR=1 FL=1